MSKHRSLSPNLHDVNTTNIGRPRDVLDVPIITNICSLFQESNHYTYVVLSVLDVTYTYQFLYIQNIS